jgi:hypothetical protein
VCRGQRKKFNSDTAFLLGSGIHQIVLWILSGLCYLRQQLADLVLSKKFLIAIKISNSLSSSQEYPAKSVRRRARGIIPNSGASNKLAGFFIMILLKLVNLAPLTSVRIISKILIQIR